MSDALDISSAPAGIQLMLEDACEELARKGFNVTPQELLAIRQRQATGEVRWDDPPVTTTEAPTRTVKVKMADGKFEDKTFDRDQTPGLSPLDSAVRKMRSAAYAYNEGDYTATAIMARESFLEVQAALADKTFMDVAVELEKPSEKREEIESGE